MSAPSIISKDLARYGPTQSVVVSADEAREYCFLLAKAHRENFAVLSPLVPERCRADFAAIYGFCRWADDLADEMQRTPNLTSGELTPSRNGSDLLAWWRGELEAMIAGEARHPVFIALRESFTRCALTPEPFRDLLRAFELDQVKRRYATWDELLGYCALSANPVGRMVLAVLGEKGGAAQAAASDALCTALQLTNHWQDIRRDWELRERIYVPSDMHAIDAFESRLAETIARGYSADRTFFTDSRRLVRRLVARTWDLYEQAEPLVASASIEARPLLWLFAAGGRGTLRTIERWNCESILERPVLSPPRKAAMVLRAMSMRWLGISAPTLPLPSAWIVDPEPDPEAQSFPRVSAMRVASEESVA